ncbi:Transcriptional Regulator, LysR family protein [Marinomonas sp. MED121]|uniref:LysR family transcriptional regulator n=1 Tax=Marinomonas sp. MED121 TaxID=314277 RepID=UPI00006909D0|nr:LysR family transcriptional regulator [Marinomonas sp. MED121]EAQ63181.1 Transcriptional Regulator, LysR family protein [Marinomonas sp. MED121]
MIKESDYPPLSVLIAFETTVRKGSMTAAAKELGITQPLVSQRIRSLEDYMGGVLLDRTHKPIKTTLAGRKFYQELKVYLSPLLTSLEKTKTSFNDNKIKVSISAYFGFAFYWLLPRLNKLQAHFPNYLFEVRPTNSKSDMMSFNSDISFHFCNELGEYRFEELFIEEEVFPVCSPALANKLKLSEKQTLTNLSELPLLHKDQNDARWINWQNWSNILGVNIPADPVSFCYQNYPLTIEAAIAGQGICLGWKGLLDKQLEEGTLIALKPALISPKRGYHICSNYKSTATIGPVIDWLIEEQKEPKRL